MGNAGSAQGPTGAAGSHPRDYRPNSGGQPQQPHAVHQPHKQPENVPSSPHNTGQTFAFDRSGETHKRPLVHQGSQEDDAPVFTTPKRELVAESEEVARRRRANTINEGEVSLTPTVFRWDGGGKEVYVSGTFNEWRAQIPMVQSHGNFVTIVDLPEGEHQFQYYVDGHWRNDPQITVVESKGGTVTNQINVRKSDMEVFEALDKDSEASENESRNKGDYSQEIPSTKPWEKQSGPPILPPHLLNVILNKDTPLQCEPTLLPEPNHVMLNHLYALSIKDGVMVLSATHRYRKKYVTTLLYKPI